MTGNGSPASWKASILFLCSSVIPTRTVYRDHVEMIRVKNKPPSMCQCGGKSVETAASTGLRSTRNLHTSFAANMQDSPDISAGASSKD